MADTQKKQYNSLGQMMAKGDFEMVLEKLTQYENSEDDIHALHGPAYAGSRFTIIDEMLYNIPRYIIKKAEVKEEDLNNASNPLAAMMGSTSASVQAPEVKSVELDPVGMQVVDKLLALGANPNATIYNGISPMLMAATVNNPELIKRLLDNAYETLDLDTGNKIYQRGDITAADGRGQDMMFYAAFTNALDNMNFLATEMGLNIDKQYMFDYNKTLLHLLCERLNQEHKLTTKGFEVELDVVAHTEPAIRKLIEMGANPTLEDDYENVPEMMISSVDDSPHNLENLPEETIKNWDEMFELVGKYRQYYEANSKKQYKTTF